MMLCDEFNFYMRHPHEREQRNAAIAVCSINWPLLSATLQNINMTPQLIAMLYGAVR